MEVSEPALARFVNVLPRRLPAASLNMAGMKETDVRVDGSSDYLDLVDVFPYACPRDAIRHEPWEAALSRALEFPVIALVHVARAR